MRLTMLLTISSLLGCSTVPRPDTDLCIVNAPAKHMKCYNLITDYDDDGNLYPTAHPKYKPAEKVEDLNKNTCTDPDGWANLKTYIKNLRNAYSQAVAQ